MRKGFTLIETVIASFILSLAFVAFIMLYHRALAFGAQSEARSAAARAAWRKVESVREWSAQSDNFEKGDWAGLSTPVSDPDDPPFMTSVLLIGRTLFSPSTDLESLFPGNTIDFSNSVRGIRVRVQWGGTQDFNLYTQIAAPRRPPKRPLNQAIVVTLKSPGGNLAVGGTADFEAQALDANDKPIVDLVYNWSVAPGTGNGQVTSIDRMGRKARFTNLVLLRNGTSVGNYGTGPLQCQVEAWARYQGLELHGISLPIALDTLP